ncbi:MAG: hypothetical protein LBG22_10370 [Treponema sp.]|jgi:hypothetical protein|nr:hypothetical protein [Treponema sp.]
MIPLTKKRWKMGYTSSTGKTTTTAQVICSDMGDNLVAAEMAAAAVLPPEDPAFI